jgi:hypothetical protein
MPSWPGTLGIDINFADGLHPLPNLFPASQLFLIELIVLEPLDIGALNDLGLARPLFLSCSGKSVFSNGRL